MRTISRASRETPAFANPHHCGGAIYRWLAAEPSDQSSTGGPVIRRHLGARKDRDFEIRNGRGNLENTTLDGAIKTRRVVSHAPEGWGSWLPDRLRQPDYLPPGSVPKDEGRRLSALRPYLTAGLPLSVQSMLIKELAWIGKEGKHD